MKFYEQFSKYMEEADIKGMDMDPELAPETGPQEAFKALADALDKFYDLGKKGLSPDPQAVNDRVYNILVQHEVDEKNLKNFSDVLMSIILGQSMRGYADSQ